MANDAITRAAMDIGKTQARETLARRKSALRKRDAALRAHAKAKGLAVPRGRALEAGRVTAGLTAGVLVAEGDSWFDYPFVDILGLLDDEYGYDVESVAHKGDPIEDMAYGGSQLTDFVRRLEKVKGRGQAPKAVLLSGGGNDVAGAEFGMLLNHAASAIAGLNAKILDGVVDERIRAAYVTILSRVTAVCQQQFGRPVPVLVHGYDYPVPDGRGFMGGWGPLPGPWLEPGFRRKGFGSPALRLQLARDLIDRFNAMLQDVAGLSAFSHVTYIDLRGTLPTGGGYKTWWANELHPTHRGFKSVTEKFAKVLARLP